MEKALLDIAEQLKTVEYLDDKALTKVINRNNKRILEQAQRQAQKQTQASHKSDNAPENHSMTSDNDKHITALAGSTPSLAESTAAHDGSMTALDESTTALTENKPALDKNAPSHDKNTPALDKTGAKVNPARPCQSAISLHFI